MGQLLSQSGLPMSLYSDEKYIYCEECGEGKEPPGTGFFSVDGIDLQEPVFPQPQGFRNLKKHLVRHFTTTAEHSHVYVPTEEENTTLRLIGLRNAMTAYSIIYHGNSFASFEDRVCQDIAAKIDVGNINHSMFFFYKFLENTYDVVRQRVREFFNTPLPCTNRLPVICVKPDKFSKGGTSNQAVMVRHPCLKNGEFMRETYIGHLPANSASTGQELTELLINSLHETLAYQPESRLRDVFAGIACDGAYLSLNIETHMSQQLQLPSDYVHEVTRHDFGHRIELVDLHAREFILWIRNLDRDLKEFMKDNKDYGQRDRLEKKCVEMGKEFYCFVLYSDTRFAQYRHRTYKVFIKMYPVLYRLVSLFSFILALLFAYI